MQRIPESTCLRNETGDIDLLVTSRNGHRKIMQLIRIASRPPSRERKGNKLSQFRETPTKSNTYRKDSSWLQFNYEPKIQGR